MFVLLFVVLLAAVVLLSAAVFGQWCHLQDAAAVAAEHESEQQHLRDAAERIGAQLADAQRQVAELRRQLADADRCVAVARAAASIHRRGGAQ